MFNTCVSFPPISSLLPRTFFFLYDQTRVSPALDAFLGSSWPRPVILPSILQKLLVPTHGSIALLCLYHTVSTSKAKDPVRFIPVHQAYMCWGTNRLHTLLLNYHLRTGGRKEPTDKRYLEKEKGGCDRKGSDFKKWMETRAG